MVKNEVVKSGQNTQNLRPRAWVCEVQTGPPAQRQLVRGLAAAYLQDPQKGSQNGQNKVKFRVPEGPSKVPPGKGYK